jgi:hypothetical protein
MKRVKNKCDFSISLIPIMFIKEKAQEVCMCYEPWLMSYKYSEVHHEILDVLLPLSSTQTSSLSSTDILSQFRKLLEIN